MWPAIWVAALTIILSLLFALWLSPRDAGGSYYHISNPSRHIVLQTRHIGDWHVVTFHLPYIFIGETLSLG